MTPKKKSTPEKQLQDLEKAVVFRKPDMVADTLEQGLGAGFDSTDALMALLKGLETCRRGLGDHSLSVPEFLLSVDAARAGFARLGQEAAVVPSGKKAVIGVVQGDVHDLGKNVVAAVLEAGGYEVTDLGRDVPAGEFVRAAVETGAEIVALSSMMSTPLAAMEKTVEEVRKAAPKAMILVGGAAVDQTLAQRFRADGYALSAADVPGLIQGIASGRAPEEESASRVFMDYTRRVQVVEGGSGKARKK